MAVRDLRRSWKPHKADFSNHPTGIRFHRACSWLQRAEVALEADDQDVAVVTLWVAMNSLYGRWDASRVEAEPDRPSWRRFLTRILAIDTKNTISHTLIEHKKLVMAILNDAYLNKYFWREPSSSEALKTTRDKRKAATWYIEQNWTMVLDALVDQIYLLRCQLVHGAATHDSSYNRESLRRCTDMLQHLHEAVLTVWIEDGRDEDWGEMCYPPVKA